MSSLARKLGISEPTLRSRVNGYLRSGFFGGWSLLINPNATGHSSVLMHLDVLPPSSKNDAVAKIRLVDGVWDAPKYHGNTLGVALFYDTEATLKKRMELIARIANSERIAYGHIPFPPCSYGFTSADLAILEIIQENPGMTYSSISRKTGLSTKTVRRRLGRMMQERALFVAPRVDHRRLKGAIGADLFIVYTNEQAGRDTERGVLKLVEKVHVASVRGREILWVGMILQTLGEADEILSAAKMLEGVREAYVDLVEEHVSQYEVFTDELKRLTRGEQQSGLDPSRVRAPQGIHSGRRLAARWSTSQSAPDEKI